MIRYRSGTHLLCNRKTYTIQGSDGTVYVDRAAQRRDGIANSYEAVEQELKQLSGDDPESYAIDPLEIRGRVFTPLLSPLVRHVHSPLRKANTLVVIWNTHTS